MIMPGIRPSFFILRYTMYIISSVENKDLKNDIAW